MVALAHEAFAAEGGEVVDVVDIVSPVVERGDGGAWQCFAHGVEAVFGYGREHGGDALEAAVAGDEFEGIGHGEVAAGQAEGCDGGVVFGHAADEEGAAVEAAAVAEAVGPHEEASDGVVAGA